MEKLGNLRYASPPACRKARQEMKKKKAARDGEGSQCFGRAYAGDALVAWIIVVNKCFLFQSPTANTAMIDAQNDCFKT